MRVQTMVHMQISELYGFANQMPRMDHDTVTVLVAVTEYCLQVLGSRFLLGFLMIEYVT